jgi:uncharacterized heparinase superfamily protein
VWGVRTVVTPVLRTLLDMGPRRLQRRLRYEGRQRLDRVLQPSLALALAGASGKAASWRPEALAGLAQPGLTPRPAATPDQLSFTFLHDTRTLAWPIPWNRADWPRLWQFHLHYCDWARVWLEQALDSGAWPDQASALEPLLDHWIAANRPADGDGWHSYTTALRSRNWIWLLRCCPALATPPRLQSLWKQLCWLQAHPEHCHGGNHWLENLTALAIGGLQFEGPRATAMHQRAMALLERELPRQILADGGHEERSAAYHLLLLDRLVELAWVLQAERGIRPVWLGTAIAAMLHWGQTIRLGDGTFPRFNDSAADAAPALDLVLAFARAWLDQRAMAGHSLRARLSQLQGAPVVAPSIVIATPAPLVVLPDTGWTLLRPGGGWEIAFKCGQPCPPHLPAHTHSDQLSLDVFCRGEPLLAEAGTSVYGSGDDRAYERSGAAHNLLQLGRQQTGDAAWGSVQWIEPVEVWHGFRAGRKAQPRQRASGPLGPGRWFVEGSHDGFDLWGAAHHRRVEVQLCEADGLELVVTDTVTTTAALLVRLWWHLGPTWDARRLPAPQVQADPDLPLTSRWVDTWMAQGFGRRSPRRSLCVESQLSAGEHRLISRVTWPAS